ncbi:hypothetical protein [Acidithrix sp. C25]|uniref:hypothetical protein n=1 Tax=Acidithrix sp. C25 TaxID=1671482 RepID=UPI00191B94BC|nr:hypothetical protein [Acidithrix sp. C25]
MTEFKTTSDRLHPLVGVDLKHEIGNLVAESGVVLSTYSAISLHVLVTESPTLWTNSY